MCPETALSPGTCATSSWLEPGHMVTRGPMIQQVQGLILTCCKGGSGRSRIKTALSSTQMQARALHTMREECCPCPPTPGSRPFATLLIWLDRF